MAERRAGLARERGRGGSVRPHPQHAGPKIPTSLNVRKKVTIASLRILSIVYCMVEAVDYMSYRLSYCGKRKCSLLKHIMQVDCAATQHLLTISSIFFVVIFLHDYGLYIHEHCPVLLNYV
jgi:hypothetical protein